MDELPSMDDLWEESLRDTRESEGRTRDWIEKQVYRAIRDLRVQHGTHIEIRVLVPWCGGCVHFESRALETEMPMPDILGSWWKQFYRDLGMSAREIAHVRRGFRDGWLPRCEQCGSEIDIDEGVYVRSTDLSLYFDLYVRSGRIPGWMKKAVREVFGATCGECGKPAGTLDHIVAKTHGGLTEVVNLRPLREQCNQKKADQQVELVQVSLAFPLCPPPSDGFEGVIW